MNKLWRFTDNLGTFNSESADKIKALYFPLANDKLMSSITPGLHGDIKTSQDSFLLTPVSRQDLADSRSSRNFWVKIGDCPRRGLSPILWSATGVSKDLKQTQEDKFSLEAGLLWQKIIRKNNRIGLKAEILSFVPVDEPIEIMQVKLTNISSHKIKFIPTAAIPIYGRGANNLRDHRHVTSLLHRITLNKFGVVVKPTLSFNEDRHEPNKRLYFVLGWDEKGSQPQYIYPTQGMFCGEAGDLEAPEALLKNVLPGKGHIQGREAMGALRFRPLELKPGEARHYIILMGITEDARQMQKIIPKFNSLAKVKKALKANRDFWLERAGAISVSTSNPDFDNWFRWVNAQPVLRRIFGCSFLPDFDYGKGGRGWRDLWQDCLGLILNSPAQARNILINNFSGARIDGSNATIIGKNTGEFVADRNDIARVWADHGVWPLLAMDLYINETGDTAILWEEAGYFRDQHLRRSTAIDRGWSPASGNKLKTKAGKIYQGTIFEHLLAQNLTQFFNVGAHNHIRLEGADWNDGLDMAKENGESAAFSAMYAQNLRLLAVLLMQAGRKEVAIAEELKILLAKIDYNNISAKNNLLQAYFKKTEAGLSGKKISLNSVSLARDLGLKSQWITQHIRKREWLEEGFFNGYYDNQKKRVEGRQGKVMRMMLQSQVFSLMSGVADEAQAKKVLQSSPKYLWDKKLKGYRLNTDFGKEQHCFGRAFSFIYGDKENGAFFNHMVVMFAYALYKRGYIEEGWQALNSIYEMAMNTEVSKIYPCLPEYFNGEGRGMYLYLTGSASWFVLVLLTQAFGVKGQNGDLVIEPKLSVEQFKHSPDIAITRAFSGRQLKVVFSNPHKVPSDKYRIVKASLNFKPLALEELRYLIIPRKTILNLPEKRLNILAVVLGF